VAELFCRLNLFWEYGKDTDDKEDDPGIDDKGPWSRFFIVTLLLMPKSSLVLVSNGLLRFIGTKRSGRREEMFLTYRLKK